MPSPGTTLKNGKRHNFVDKSFWKEFIKETGIEITYADFVSVINLSNQKIQESIVNNVLGFKFPEYMGYSVVTRYKPRAGNRQIDFKKTKELGIKVYHTNFHSFGYMPRIAWLTNELSTCKYLSIYKFVPERKFSRTVSNAVQEGKVYNEYTYDHFKSKRIKVNIDKLS